jgi:hypothetical protein
MGYDEAVQVVAEVGSVGNGGLSKNIFLIVGIVVGSVIVVTVAIIIICLLCNYFPKRAVVA